MRRLLRRSIARLRYLQGPAADRSRCNDLGAIEMRRWIRLAVAAGGALLAALQQAAAQDALGNDLRNIRIGIAVADLPSAGYVDFSCAVDTDRKLSGWSDWRDCPAGADGLRALRFGYDPATSRNGTVVAGHPVILTALIDNAGTVAGL